MSDETLIDKEISAFGNELLEPFEACCVKGTSYDIRVGSAAILPAPTADGKVQAVALGMPPLQESVSILPGSTCIIQSLELIHLPTNMKGRLALRAFHARNLIFFVGGIIDPGYDGFLYLPIANLGDIPITLKYGEALVTAEFTKLGKEAMTYQPGSVLPTEISEHPVAFDRAKLSSEVREQGESIREILKRLESSEIILNASQRILDFVVLSAVAGGTIAVVMLLLPKMSFPWNGRRSNCGGTFGYHSTRVSCLVNISPQAEVKS